MWHAAAALHIMRHILILLDNACLPNYKNGGINYTTSQSEKKQGGGGGGGERWGWREATNPTTLSSAVLTENSVIGLCFSELVADITTAFERKRMVCRKGTQDKSKNWCDDVYSLE